MKILDLFCGAGGASMGYHRAFPAAQIVGVDINPQPDYPFHFIQRDVMAMDDYGFDEFDLIHASPPCQLFSTATPADAKPKYPDWIAPVRELIQDNNYVIENVQGAPLRQDLMLCGSMFGLQVQRHRYFEHNLPLIMAPACNHTRWVRGFPLDVTGKPCGRNATITGDRKRRQWRDVAEGREAMGVEWIRLERQIAEAIPPAYTQYIGEHYGR